MNYKLAQQLRDAGFMPSFDDSAEYYIADDVIVHRKDILGMAKHSNGDNVAMNNWVYKPSSDSIMAKITGVQFALEKLATQDVIYRAYIIDEAGEPVVSFTSPEPDTAVALLWLKLYGK